MRSRRLLVLTSVLSVALAAFGCSKKKETAQAATPASTETAESPAQAPAVGTSVSSAPTPAQTQQERETNSQLEDLRLQLDAYQKIYKRKPASLAQMVQEGFMTSLPPPPPGRHFNYDPASGKVDLAAN